MRTRIEPATADHINEISKMVRPHDRDELMAAFGQIPDEAMADGLRYSDALTGYIDDQPVCMWGVAPVCLLTGLGAPWMVGTSLLDRFALPFMRECRPQVLELFSNYARLENYVDVRNVRAIRWLKALGFTVDDEAQPYGIYRLPFRRFWREA